MRPSHKNDKNNQTENAALDIAVENDSLKKNTETSASLLFDIEGDYKFKDVAAGCTLDLKLYSEKGILKIYPYHRYA